MNEKAKIITTCTAFVVAAGLGAATFLSSCKSKDTPTVGKAEPVTTEATEAETVPLYAYVPSETGMTERAKMLLKQNKDVAGWIKIPNTDVDYPFVKDPGYIPENVPFYGGAAYEPNYFYLDHSFAERTPNREGTLFMDYRDMFGSIEEEQSENILIYGHNMANNTMFGSIRRYRQDYGFFEQAPFVELSSNYKDYDYVMCCFSITSGNWYTDFPYWTMEELDDEKSFNDYINTARSRQLFDTGVDVKYGDKLLTMSTCYADEDNSRFIIIARRLRPNEVAGDLSTIERTDEYKKAHTPTEPASETAAAEQ